MFNLFKEISWPRHLAAWIIIALVTGCTSFEDTGNADVTLTPDGQDPVRLVHDPLLSQVLLTPPAEGVMELTYTYQDPYVPIALTVNGNVLSEGQRLELPLAGEITSEDVAMEIEHDGTSYSSATDDAAGFFQFDTMYFDDNNADIRVTFDVTLQPTTGEGSPLLASGFIEGVAGDPVYLDE